MYFFFFFFSLPTTTIIELLDIKNNNKTTNYYYNCKYNNRGFFTPQKSLFLQVSFPCSHGTVHPVLLE